MKKLVITAALVLASLFNAFAMEDGHVLTDLWRRYEDARREDRPQKEAEILSEIKAEALRKHLPVDFYDASTKYVNTVLRRDWKQGDKLREDLEVDVKRLNHPLITFLWMKEWKRASQEELWTFVKEHPKGFEGYNPALYRGVEGFLNGALKPFIRTDREYVLWNLLQARRYASPEQEEIYKVLKEELDGRYPSDGALEYWMLSRKSFSREELPLKRQALQALRSQYAGKALALFPEADWLLMDKEELDLRKAGGKEYKALSEACKRFEWVRKNFTGEEATLAKACTGVEYLLQQLESQDLDVRVEKGRAQVIFRNLYHANLTLRQGKKTLQTWKVVNFDESYYAQDTVSMDLPQLPDGEYLVEAKSGQRVAETAYSQFTLSMAMREDALGRSIYVADYKSGEPLSFVTLRLLSGDREVASANLKLNGFTLLPKALEGAMKENSYYTLEAVFGERRSQGLGLGRKTTLHTRNDSRTRCSLFLDRGAYNPGDTVKYKAIVFEGDPATGLKVCKGRAVTLLLKDSEDKVLDTKELKTGNWGSVAGEFVLPTGLRGGMFQLAVKDLASEAFRVDEYVLPSFDLTFDPLTELYLEGSEVPVSGIVTSYSGHSLTGARVAVTVSRFGKVALEKEAPLGADGRFLFPFPADERGDYYARVRVTDATGETLEFTRCYRISSWLQVETSFPDAVEADFFQDLSPENPILASRQQVITGKRLRVILQAIDGSREKVPVPVSYELTTWEGKSLLKGTLPSGETLGVDLPAAGVYFLHTSVEAVDGKGQPVKGERWDAILYLPEGEKKLPKGVLYFFDAPSAPLSPGEAIRARVAEKSGKIYAQVALFGENKQVLVNQQVTIDEGEVGQLSLPYLDSYPDAVRLVVFYFKDGQQREYQREFRRAKDQYTLPLSFTRFQDKAYPGTQYTFQLKTQPGVEVLAAAWDKSLDAIAPNVWPLVSMRERTIPYVTLYTVLGREDGSYGRIRLRGYATKSAANVVLADAAMVEEEEAIPFQLDKTREVFREPEVKVRTDFSSALTFQPRLYPKADGTLEFSFRTSDKLSTFYVRVYAHDKSMKNALCEKEMLVSLPVKVSLVPPRFLYRGDSFEAAVTVSSMADAPVSGTLELRAGDCVQQLPVTVKPGEVETRSFPVSAADAGTLTLKASFLTAEFSDAVQLDVPVFPAAQELSEAHSAVLLDGMSREALLEELRSRFVNVPGSEAVLREISVLEMVKDAIPRHVEPRSDDVLSLTEAWYTRLVASRLGVPAEETGELLEKILACRNNDGGLGWFQGMPSNAVITAVVLERMALLRDRGFEVPEMTESVKFLDNRQFGTVIPLWRGWLSDAQYMRVRSLYSEVPFEVKPVSATQKKRLAQFKKDAKAYLTPSKSSGRGLEGQILAKARRLLTLRSLSATEKGRALASAWGIGLSSRLEKSIRADVTSLLEYAVQHRDGGWYYPNAVMPFRGLLESEAYAHALLCQLLKADSPVIADGIRLWLMLQKETQKWDTDPAYVDAITAILDGSEAVLNTKVLALSACYEAPFEGIQAAGNGFTVERKFFRGNGQGGWAPLQEGEELPVGEKVRVVYKIWNAENRSFVKLSAGREASLSPVEQLSGYMGGGYRHVKASATDFYFDSYPEEASELREEFFVTQAGRFVAPVTVIESLYAPHYRANSAFRPPLTSVAP